MLHIIGENGITEQGKVSWEVLPGILDHVKLDGERHSRNNPEEGVGLLRTSQRQVDSGSLEAQLEVAAGTSLQKCRAAGRASAACDWRDVAGWDYELGSVGRGDWPRPAAVRMQTGCSALRCVMLIS